MLRTVLGVLSLAFASPAAGEWVRVETPALMANANDAVLSAARARAMAVTGRVVAVEFLSDRDL